MSNATAWLIRHGQSTSQLGGWSCNPNDILLTEKGQAQALEVAVKIDMRPDLIISSPMQRALQTAAPTLRKWADTPIEIWPIQELTYLSPSKHQHKTEAERKIVIKNYWQQAQPTYCDGEDCESFEHFIQRLKTFQQALAHQQGFVVLFGHAQFFKAFMLGQQRGFIASPDWMRLFRQWEMTHSLLNGEIIYYSFSHPSQINHL